MYNLIQEYKVVVGEVHSGDDLIVSVDLGFDGVSKQVRVRLRGVDTPDAHRASPDTEAGKVREWLVSRLSDSRCYIRKHHARKTGWLVTLYATEGGGRAGDYSNVNEELIQQGYIFQSSTNRVPT